jgi:hypothetical protein
MNERVELDDIVRKGKGSSRRQEEDASNIRRLSDSKPREDQKNRTNAVEQMHRHVVCHPILPLAKKMVLGREIAMWTVFWQGF